QPHPAYAVYRRSNLHDPDHGGPKEGCHVPRAFLVHRKSGSLLPVQGAQRHKTEGLHNSVCRFQAPHPGLSTDTSRVCIKQNIPILTFPFGYTSTSLLPTIVNFSLSTLLMASEYATCSCSKMRAASVFSLSMSSTVTVFCRMIGP